MGQLRFILNKGNSLPCTLFVPWEHIPPGNFVCHGKFLFRKIAPYQMPPFKKPRSAFNNAKRASQWAARLSLRTAQRYFIEDPTNLGEKGKKVKNQNLEQHFVKQIKTLQKNKEKQKVSNERALIKTLEEKEKQIVILKESNKSLEIELDQVKKRKNEAEKDIQDTL